MAATLTSYESCESTGTAADFFPRKITLPTLARAAEKCHGCPLYCRATQVVFGGGPTSAKIMLIGEQPGDKEDLAGKPFVGPSGRLDESLAAAKLDRSDLYVTNAVKHFKWTSRGKRRLHSKPTWTEIVACRPWLEQEIKLVSPVLLVTLGASAGQSVLGKTFRLTQHRGEFQESPFGQPVLATVHPSSLLRIPGESERREARQAFVADLRRASRKIQ